MSSALPVIGVHSEPAVAEPVVTKTLATPNTPSLSSYSIMVPTSDGGRFVVLFAWQLGATWKWPWRSEPVGNVFDMPLTLQMSKVFQNGSLDFAVTYSPLYLIQYDDVNGNGLLDIRASRAFREEVPPNQIEWTNADTPLAAYSLTPVFQLIDFERGVAPTHWHWQVGSLQNQSVTINNSETYEFSWDASAEVPNLEWSLIGSSSETENTTVDVNFGFHLMLVPDKPQIKYDFNLSGVSWLKGKNVKLTLLSAVQYQSKKTAVVGTDGEHYGFDKTWAFKSQRATISESATSTMKAFITYRSDAVVDEILQPDVVKTSFQPLFLIPTHSPVPSGVYIEGVKPDLATREPMPEARWNYVAFSHQVGLPKFNSSLSQDPVIGAEVLLFISGFGLPENLLTPQVLTLTTVVVTLAFAIYWLKAKRSLKRPMTGLFALPLLRGSKGTQVYVAGGEK